MKFPIRSAGDCTGKLLRIGRKAPANRAALQVLEEAAAYVRDHPELESLILMVGSPGQCRPFMTPIDNPLDFIGMLELMKHDLFREK
ncbi:MAG: hypothetical protein BroJett014_31860 [Planctomycetota bacterium]|nr:hypothetical protein [Rhodocyclaceae bacterium]GIK54213.1 MAG: hypothetical protein BroJett014_31860 [Planctomycetota bacterium]